MVTSAELPRNLRVAGVAEARDRYILIENSRPYVPTFEVTVPVNLIAQLGRTGTKQIDAMLTGRVSLRADYLSGLS
jgi:hypothetical protein